MLGFFLKLFGRKAEPEDYTEQSRTEAIYYHNDMAHQSIYYTLVCGRPWLKPKHVNLAIRDAVQYVHASQLDFADCVNLEAMKKPIRWDVDRVYRAAFAKCGLPDNEFNPVMQPMPDMLRIPT